MTKHGLASHPPEGSTRCYGCFRPIQLCFCDGVPRIENRVEVLIFQHVRERWHAFNTARIVSRSLQRCRLIVDHTQGFAKRDLPVQDDAVLLYPDQNAPPVSELRHRKPTQLRYIMLSLLLFLVICANVIWLAERGRAHDTTFDDRWLVGVGQAMWWTIVTMTTVGYGDFVPRKPISRVLSILIIVTGIVLFGMAVGVFSSSLTLKQMHADIRVPRDLRNKPVAVVENSLAERRLRTLGVEMVPRKNLGDALDAVDKEEVLAAVHDVALLRYNVPRHYPKLLIVGPTFAEQGYGIAFPLNSHLRKEVNVALLQLMESEPPRYRWMLEQWFEMP